MNRKSVIGAVIGLLLLTGIIGANLVMARPQRASHTNVGREATVEEDNLDCPAQGLPACKGQMHDDKSEGPENEADEGNEKADASENEADEGNDKADASENEADEGNEQGEGPETNDNR
jgi:hypothetical protein